MSILITLGDPLGIGPEVTIKAIKRLSNSKRKKIILVGNEYIFRKAGWEGNLCPILNSGFTKNVDNLTKKDAAFESFKSLEVATKLISKGLSLGCVTAPISKNLWLSYGIPYNGHTDYFRKVFKKDFLMCFLRKNIISGIVTEHIPLKDVSKNINKNLIVFKVKLLYDFLKKLKIKFPSVAISCLNPHCGEEGKIGVEEIKYIKPAISYLKKLGFKVLGPFNPEDCIKKNINGEINASLFMYHDQLIPLIKSIDLKKNDIVHITWGLGFVRTSPAHGSAQDIAWKNIADYLSMYKAIEMTLRLLY
ncbi:MAG: 4-hydroxythreonine-4-phosphate dehydrogenase PdxA [Elusimicrobiales bacterium]|nr:4-hydroxythreonine-4-phosphate dehydrogenase PdxA [Elusimicrobiales bacterium]